MTFAKTSFPLFVPCFQAMGFALLSSSVDLSSFAVEIGKMLATSLHSQTDITRELAVFGSKALARRVSSEYSDVEVRHGIMSTFS